MIQLHNQYAHLLRNKTLDYRLFLHRGGPSFVVRCYSSEVHRRRAWQDEQKTMKQSTTHKSEVTDLVTLTLTQSQ